MAQSDLRNVERARERIRQAEEELVQAILAARDSGETLQDIGDRAALSRQRIHEIVSERRKPQPGE